MNAAKASSAVLSVLLARVPVAGILCFCGQPALAIGLLALTEAALLVTALRE